MQEKEKMLDKDFYNLISKYDTEIIKEFGLGALVTSTFFQNELEGKVIFDAVKEKEKVDELITFLEKKQAERRPLASALTTIRNGAAVATGGGLITAAWAAPIGLPIAAISGTVFVLSEVGRQAVDSVYQGKMATLKEFKDNHMNTKQAKVTGIVENIEKNTAVVHENSQNMNKVEVKSEDKRKMNPKDTLASNGKIKER